MKVSLAITRCENLRFLEKVVDKLVALCGDELQILRVSDSADASKAIAQIGEQPDGMVVILSHGVDGCLLVKEHSVDDSGQKLPRWMVPDEMGCLDGKHVFCLACQSNSLLGDARSAGASGFVGFGDIEHFVRGSDGSKLDLPDFERGFEECLVETVNAILLQILSGRVILTQLQAITKLVIRKQAQRCAQERKYFYANEIARKFLKIEGQCVGFAR